MDVDLRVVLRIRPEPQRGERGEMADAEGRSGFGGELSGGATDTGLEASKSITWSVVAAISML